MIWYHYHIYYVKQTIKYHLRPIIIIFHFLPREVLSQLVEDEVIQLWEIIVLNWEVGVSDYESSGYDVLIREIEFHLLSSPEVYTSRCPFHIPLI